MSWSLAADRGFFQWLENAPEFFPIIGTASANTIQTLVFNVGRLCRVSRRVDNAAGVSRRFLDLFSRILI